MDRKFFVFFWFWTRRDSELIIVSKRRLMSKTHFLQPSDSCLSTRGFLFLHSWSRWFVLNYKTMYMFRESLSKRAHIPTLSCLVVPNTTSYQHKIPRPNLGVPHSRESTNKSDINKSQNVEISKSWHSQINTGRQSMRGRPSDARLPRDCPHNCH